MKMMNMQRFAWAALLAVTYAAVSLAQDATDSETGVPKDAAAEKRITFLRDKMARYRVTAADESQAVYPLEDKLALRWSNPVSGVVDGGIFVWSDGRRPMVIGKCFLNEAKEAWGEAIQSVAPMSLTMSLEGREIWKPAGPGVTFHPVAGPTKPANTATGRLRQMRELARGVEVVGIWGEKEASEWVLRMLTTPVYRYRSEPDRILDGAVFGFTQGGTNPEALILVELIEKDEGPQWQVAAARLSQYAVVCKIGETVIADLPRNETPKIDEPFYRGWHWFTRYPFPKTEAASSEPPVR